MRLALCVRAWECVCASQAGMNFGFFLKRFVEFGQQRVKTTNDALVALDFTLPAPLLRVSSEGDLQGSSLTEPGGVCVCRDELCASEVEIALARPLLGQPQAMAEFQFR